jgi:hypothetical protein
MLEATELVEKTILGNMTEEAAGDEANPELNKPVEIEADALEDEIASELLGTFDEDSEVLDIALVI